MSKLKIENSHAELVSASRLCNKLAKTLLAISAIFAFVSCEPLQGTLSSEQNERMIEDTGYPTLAEKAWYYNGKAGEDVTSQAGFLRIDYGQYVKACDNGISGSFLIAYTDISSGNEMTVKKSLAGGMPSGTSFCLDMSPVIEMIDGNTFKDGTATVTVNLSGLVCNAGSQKGRSVSSLSQAVKIKPLVSVTPSVSTKSAPAGTKFAISLPTAISLASSPTISVTSSDSAFPSTANWSLSGLSSDGKTLYYTCDTDLTKICFDANITVNGIISCTDVISQSVTWSAEFVNILYSGSFSGTGSFVKLVDSSDMPTSMTKLTAELADMEGSDWWFKINNDGMTWDTASGSWDSSINGYSLTVTDSTLLSNFISGGIYAVTGSGISGNLTIKYK